MTDKQEKELIEGCPWRKFDALGEPKCQTIVPYRGNMFKEVICTAPDCGPMYFAMGENVLIEISGEIQKKSLTAELKKVMWELMEEAQVKASEMLSPHFKGGKITPAASGDEGKVDITAINPSEEKKTGEIQRESLDAELWQCKEIDEFLSSRDKKNRGEGVKC